MIPLYSQKKIWFAILVSTLGYFVDVYDIILFSVVRVPSLEALLVPQEQITSIGFWLINIQLIGMLIGGVLWGILGDKRGRLSVLFGSIILYSIANFLNAFVANVEQYAILRFFAGLGLAGEFGAGVTLASELMSQKGRGYGVTVITTAGVLGGIAGGLMGNLFSWQMAYMVGGIAGLVLLFLRLGVIESNLFLKIKMQEKVVRGNLRLFIQSPILLRKYLKCLLVGTPFWIFVGLFMAFSPEIGRALILQAPINVGWAILFFNVGLGIGDISSGLLSQALASRKKVIILYCAFTLMILTQLFSLSGASALKFYIYCSLLGFGAGYWAVFMMMISEQFGTNVRAIATVSLPNMVRGMGLPLSLLLAALKSQWGILWSIEIIAIAGTATALVMMLLLKESYYLQLDFVEEKQ